MGLPGHRRTSSDKRRRAAHFALEKPPLSKDNKGAVHLSHHAAPGATEYNGKKIHRKGGQRKLEKLIKKAQTAHEHDHAGHEHAH
jgi:ribosomal protein L32